MQPVPAIRCALLALAISAGVATASSTTRPDALCPAGRPARPRIRSRSSRYLAQLSMLKMRLSIFLYGHPVDDLPNIMNAIDNAQSMGEVGLLLDYILAHRGHAARIEARAMTPEYGQAGLFAVQ
jgi:hypothetical protein